MTTAAATTTAEWKCTKCGVTNRRLMPAGATEGRDRCVTCRTWHEIRPGARPPFWEAAAQS
jgi:hypothetical protein